MTIDAAAVYALATHNSELGRQVREAIDVTECALAEYGADKITLSFNGGKDCTVLVHVLAAVLLRHGHSKPIPSIYIPCKAPFSEVEQFITTSVDLYNLDLFRSEMPDGTPVTNMKTALAAYKEHHPARATVFIGTRRGDPHGANLKFVDPTDGDWPAFLRVHPIINWSYSSIWAFLRTLDVPYCHLYDEGYTSLGSTYNTFRNPALRIDTPNGGCAWLPAYELEDGSLERAGRGSAPAPCKSKTAPTTALVAPTALAPALPALAI